MTSDLLEAAHADGMIEHLPPRGLPRELTAEGWPIPFAVKQTWMGVAWAEVDSKLSMLCTLDGRCHMCGDPVAEAEAFAFVDAMGRAVDGWIMHRRCVRLARAHCPFLQRAHGRDVFTQPAEQLATQLRAEVWKKGGA